MDERLSEHFKAHEFQCQGLFCCGHAAPIDQEFIEGLELFRAKVAEFLGHEVPIRVNSGFRCPTHNATIPTASLNSQHTRGRAADIRLIPGMTVEEMAATARTIQAFHAGGIGIYSGFLHLDNGPRRWRGGRI